MSKLLSSIVVMSFLVLTFAVSSPSFGQDVPRQLSYQGQIKSIGETSAPTGDYPITVHLYTDADGKQEIWSDRFNARLTDGIFNITLGSGQPLPTIDRALWVGMQIGDGNVLKPLASLNASPYALAIANHSVTADKMATDYVGSISLNGEKVTARGTNVNIVTSDGLQAILDPATNAIVLSGSASKTEQKGADVQDNVLTANAPLTKSGTGNITLGITQSGTSSNGYLSSADWNTFNNKIGAIAANTYDAYGAAAAVQTNLNAEASTRATADGTISTNLNNEISRAEGAENSKLALAGGSMSGLIDMGTHAINNLTDPTNAQDAATKHYVDNATASALPTGAIIAFGDYNVRSGYTYTGRVFTTGGNSWTGKASLDGSDNNDGLGAAAAPGNGKLYACGGSNGNPLATCQEYDPNTNTWTIKASMAVARWSPAASAPGNGKLYVIGGTAAGGSTALTTCEEYDPNTDAWTTKASMSTARYGLATAAPGNGKLYAVGGYNGSFLTTCEEYDPSTNTWTTKASMSTPRYGFALAAPGNGKLYAVGGYNSSGIAMATCEEYDPGTDTWTTKASMSAARSILASASPGNGRFYALGGYSNDLSAVLSTIEEYNPQADTWTTKASMGAARGYFAAAAPGNGKIYAFWGRTPETSCEEYTPPGITLYFFTKN